ncbi:hypothetical protein PQR75_00770 [Paraburkholderia fungorum]|uniref:hypothetical protein n=1 Tax=Paraburkholderia fungorum TaxID=134537 RepID=UPI0038B94A56
MFGGEREEELGQLRLDDVVTQNGRLFLRVTDLDETQELKNAPSRRYVPVHAELLRIGFGRYADRLRDAGAEWLLPERDARERRSVKSREANG